MEGGCACNIFGCNCEGCGCRNNEDGRVRRRRRRRRRLRSPALPASTDTCADYNWYMTLSPDERRDYLTGPYCGTGVASKAAATPDAREVLEGLADANRNGVLTCDEFNRAGHIEVDRLILCGTGMDGDS